MDIRTAEVACASAWRNYLLLHKEVDEDDDRRTTLLRYLTNLCEDGEHNPDTLQRAGLAYLRKLDDLSEERDERLARYRALEQEISDPLAARLLHEIVSNSYSETTTKKSRE